MIYRLGTVTSTNDEARDARYVHGDIVSAECQTAGRGRRGHTWASEPGANLTFSAVLCPDFLNVREQFLLSEVVALALVDTFGRYGISTRIKWTNDIYAGDSKIAGVLIEQNLSGERIARSVAGIGINVNQRAFDASLPNPVSMAQLLGHDCDRAEVLELFSGRLSERYEQLRGGDAAGVQEQYRSLMYRLGERSAFRLPSGEKVMAEVAGVEPSGALVLRHDDGVLRKYLFREIEFVVGKDCAFGK